VQKRLDEIEVEVDRLVRLATKTGNIDAIADLCTKLETEREELRAKLSFVPPAIDWERLRAMAEERVLEIRGAFEASDEHRRAALRGLLAGRRLRVGPDPVREFRVDGLLEVVIETTPRPGEHPRTGGLCGSGGGDFSLAPQSTRSARWPLNLRGISGVQAMRSTRSSGHEAAHPNT
jgi:hypothetical protein